MHSIEHHITVKEMIQGLVKDPWTFVSMLGISLGVAVQWLAAHINPVITMVAGLLGLILLGLGIVEKYLAVKRSWKQDHRPKKKL